MTFGGQVNKQHTVDIVTRGGLSFNTFGKMFSLTEFLCRNLVLLISF